MKKTKQKKILMLTAIILMIIILLCDVSKGIMALLNDLLLFAGVYVVYYSIKEGDKLWKNNKHLFYWKLKKYR